MTAPALLKRHAAAAIRQLCTVPEPMTVTEWAERYRMLPETSSSPGPYRVDVAPYQRRWQDLMADPDQTCVVLCWATQLGKSTVFENALGYRIVRSPSPLILCRPKQEDAEGWAKERFRPMVQATPALVERVRLGRASDSTLRYYAFPGGFLFIPSAQSATELASRSSPFVFCDEVDRMEVIPGEGNPVEIISRRQSATDVGLLGLTSTPRDAESTIIWPYLEAGTYELYEVPCPHCDEYQPLIWGKSGDGPGLKWVQGKPASAVYCCRGCGAMIEERAKRDMLAAGQWVPTNPDGQYPSSHLNALYSPYAKSSWAVLVTEFERSQGKPADLQVFVNTRLCELWSETETQVSADDLIDRLDDGLEEEVVPVGVGALTAGVDVQANRIEVYVWGWGAGLESWLVAFDVLDGDPEKEPDNPGSIWRRLDESLARPFRHVSGQTCRIQCTLMDSGFATTQVYRYVANRRARRIHCSKGYDGSRPVVGKPTAQTTRRIPLYPVGVDTAKSEFLRSQMGEQVHGPGFVHLPGWMTSDQLKQLVAEERRRVVEKGRVKYVWRKKKGQEANEALDCRVLARAALEILGAATIAALGRTAEQLAVPVARPEDGEEGDPDTGTPKPPTAPKRRSNWLNRWR